MIDHFISCRPYSREVWFNIICQTWPTIIAGGTLGDRLVVTLESRLAWVAERQHRFTVCASLLATMEGTEWSLLHGSLNR
jgi:hypothetical protein